MNNEEIMAKVIREAYIEVYGIEKWNNLKNNEKDAVLHIVLNDFAKYVDKVLEA